jgi:phosphoribosylglycinamide formyltransferase-1
LVVLISGSGTNLQALIDASQTQPDFPARIVAVGSDNPQAAGLERAEAAGIATFVVPLNDFASRAEWDSALASRIADWQPDWVVSAGFMRILGSAVLGAFPRRIINTHPALLPSFPGAHAVRDALNYGVTVTGCTVHIVDAGVDTGPVLAQQSVAVYPDDDEASVHERIKVVERQLLVSMVEKLCRHNIEVLGRKVVFS